MHPRSFVSVAALCAGTLALPHAVEAQVATDQQAQATPAPAAPAPAAPAAPTSNAMTTPAMGGTITADPNPYSVDLGPWIGKVYVTGQMTGLGFVQNHPVPSTRGINPPTLSNGFSGNSSGEADISNGMVQVQKTDGQFQYYLDVGVYSFPVVGQSYIDASHANSALFGPLPIAYAKWVPTDSFSIEAGKLPTLIGEEGTFTYQNLNIERGLLWNVENLINRGVQGNYTWGPLGFALSWNDGYYTDRFQYLTGAVTWTVDSNDTIILAGGGQLSKYTHLNFGAFTVGSFGNPAPVLATQNQSSFIAASNQSQVDLSWTYTNGPWVVNPYVQYTHSPPVTVIPGAVFFNSGETYGASLLVGYTFDPSTTVMGVSLGGWSLPARVEWIGSKGSSTNFAAANLLGYGANSKAWTFTITPTYQYKIFFARAEASLVKASDVVQGSLAAGTFGAGFGYSGNSNMQVRGLLEAGIVF